MTHALTPERRGLRALARAGLWQLLAELAHHDLTQPLHVSCHNDRNAAHLTIGPVGQCRPPGGDLPPGYFSPIELLVVGAIGPERSLTFKQIVQGSGVKPTSELHALVRNLKARGVLTHRPGTPGVRWSDDFRKLRGGGRPGG
jgi:hypothetical protein